ncbi:sporulation protein rmd1 [Friedmanniomyces endolithicus]|nr:sporulation protein rmd1 [Friedmanniomyces endolithicus]KAK0769576.1 sporulation protein rmd1 [Friedmanniomyces endolithicus]
MASSAAAPPSDRTTLLPSHSQDSTKPPKPSRSVTFNPQVSTSSPPRRRPAFPTTSSSTAGILSSSPFVSGRDGPSQPMLSALNSKLRRRNSSGAPLQYMPQVSASKIGPQCTTRTA